MCPLVTFSPDQLEGKGGTGGSAYVVHVHVNDVDGFVEASKATCSLSRLVCGASCVCFGCICIFGTHVLMCGDTHKLEKWQTNRLVRRNSLGLQSC